MRLSIVRHEVVVGWFLALTLLLTGAGLALKARSTGMVGSTELWMFVPDGQGLQVGAPVTMRGIQVGECADVTFDDAGQVRIGCRIKDEFMRFVRVDAEGEVVPPPVLGATKVVLHPGGAEQVAPAGHVLAVRPSTALLDRVDAIGAKVERLLERVDALVSAIGATVKRVDDLSDRIQRGDGLVARLIGDAELAQHATAAIDKVDDAAGKIGPALDRAVATIDRIDHVVADAQTAIQDLRSDDGRVSTLLREAQGALGDVRESLRQIEPEKTASALRATADAIRVAAEDGGRVVRHADPVLERLQTSLASIEQAAAALQQLSRELARQPNAVIFGRDGRDGPGLRR